MLQLSLIALFYHFFVFFAFFPQCKAFLTFDDPTPAQGSDFFVGQGFTLRWSGSGHSSTMDIGLWDWDGNKLWGHWASIAISSKSFSATLPNIPSGKYYFWYGSNRLETTYDESDNFFVSLAPVTTPVTSDATTTATTISKPELPTPPTTTAAGSSHPSQPGPPPPSPTSGRAQRPGTANASSADTPHSTTIPTNSSTSAPSISAAVSGGPTGGTSNPQPNSSVTSTSNPSSTVLGSPPAATIVRSKHTLTGAIVGGTLGGAVILFTIFAFVIIRCRRRRSSSKESRTYIPTVSGDNIPRVTEHERSLQKAMATAPEEQQRITSDLERSAAENDRNVGGPPNEAEETQRLMSQMAIINARVQQLEIQEQERQSTIVDLLSPPPMYSSTQQLPVNQGAAAFVVHNSALPSAGTGVVDI